MEYTKNNFPEMESRSSKRLTLVTNGIGLSFFILIPIATVVLVIDVIHSRAIDAGIKIIITFAAILLLCFLGWLIVVMKKEAKNKITRITVDDKGLHHYIDEKLARSLHYDSLAPNPENGQYDVILNDPGDTDRPYEACVFVFNAELDNIQQQTVFLEAGAVITNGFLLKKHFLKGIMIFRPDLKIAPNVLDFFRLKEAR